MHPDFLQITIDERQRELEKQVQTAFQRRQTVDAPVPTEAVVLRLCSVHDDPALERIAELEGVPAPSGRHVVAEVNGTLVAALPLSGGAALADPFHATAHLLPLLELRAKQLEPQARGVRGSRIRSVVRASRA